LSDIPGFQNDVVIGGQQELSRRLLQLAGKRAHYVVTFVAEFDALSDEAFEKSTLTIAMISDAPRNARETTIAKTLTWVSHERLELCSDDLHFQDSGQIGVLVVPENGK
jgi:hypothetical protein